MALFGLSHDDRLRLDRAIEAATVALARLEAHEARCTDRYAESQKTLNDLKKMREDDQRERRNSAIRLNLMLTGVLVSLFMLIVREYVIRGFAHP